MMAAAVRFIGGSLAAETPKELFDSGYINLFHGDGSAPPCTVSPPTASTF